MNETWTLIGICIGAAPIVAIIIGWTLILIGKPKKLVNWLRTH